MTKENNVQETEINQSDNIYLAQEEYNRQVVAEEGWYGGPYQRTNKKFRKDYCDASGALDYSKLPTEAPASPERYPMVYRAFQLKTLMDKRAEANKKENRMRTNVDAKPKKGLIANMKDLVANNNKQKETA
tara:strand:- start:1725 stop:2117 length:393 start_codon:yes stop_codon:yes gene_type:complete